MLNSLDSFVLHADTFQRNYIVEVPNLILMKPIFLQVGEEQEFSELFKNPTYGYNVTIFVIISVNKDVVYIYADKDVELLSKDFVDKLLETCRCVC